MRKLLSIAETVRKIPDGGRFRASADALYDEAKGQLDVHLNISAPEIRPDVVRMKVAIEEVDPATREVFHNWIRKLVKQGSFSIEE